MKGNKHLDQHIFLFCLIRLRFGLNTWPMPIDFLLSKGFD